MFTEEEYCILYLESTEYAGVAHTRVTFELPETASKHIHMPQHLGGEGGVQQRLYRITHCA